MTAGASRLIYMANQIARNMACWGAEKAALALADHIAAYWEPRMRRELLALDEASFDPIVAEAVRVLRRIEHPQHQTLATGVRGGSDAG